MSLFERVREEADLLELFRDQNIALRRSGERYSCLCPFHPDRNPSCYVSKRRFKCFGCGESGDAVAFVAKIESISEGEALRRLCERYGIRGSEEVLDLAASLWHGRLTSSQQLMGLAAGLGFTEEMVRAFSLGYADASTQERVLANPEARAKGLVGPSGGLLMLGRITIPLRDPSGRVLAFQGRAVDPLARAKYMMTYNHQSFKRDLYLFDTAAYLPPQARGVAYLVEGPKDAMALALLGYRSWAFLGASFSREQLREAERRVRFEGLSLVLLMDSDAAGVRATRAIGKGLARDLWERVSVCASLPGGVKDVSDLLARGSELADFLVPRRLKWTYRRPFGPRKPWPWSDMEGHRRMVSLRGWMEADAGHEEALGPDLALAGRADPVAVWARALVSRVEDGYVLPVRALGLLAMAPGVGLPPRLSSKVPSAATILLIRVATLGLYASLRLRWRRLQARRGPLGLGEALIARRWAALGRSLALFYQKLIET